jgi:group I intron endonuclease
MSCKPALFKTGVYEILNTITNERYIGSASRVGKSNSLSGFYVRFDKHKLLLKNNKHYNIHLQRAYNKYGENNFNFNVLSICPPEYCIKLEQWFLDNLKPEYNIRKIADSNKGIKFTAEHKEKLSKSIKNSLKNKVDNSYRKRIGETLKITKLNKKNPYKRTEQGLVNNRIKRRSHSNIAKLDSEKVKDIKIMLKNKETMKTCANKYNVHIGTIQAIKSGLTWFDIKID